MACPDEGPTYEGEHILLAFLVTLGAGMSTLLGGILGLCYQPQNFSFLGKALAFSAGVMLYISIAELLAIKAVDAFNKDIDKRFSRLAAAAVFVLGCCIMKCLDRAVRKAGKSTPAVESAEDAGDQEQEMDSLSDPDSDLDLDRASYDSKHAASTAGSTPDGESPTKFRDIEVALPATVHDIQEEKEDRGDEAETKGRTNGSQHDISPAEERQKLLSAGLVTAFAIGFHNLPEGLVTFVATVKEPGIGAAIAVAIGIHNIPEGFCVSLPLYNAGSSALRPLLWTAAAGMAEPIGGIVGYYILKSVFAGAVEGCMFALVAGVMVYLSFNELLPSAQKYCQGQATTSYVILGMFIMAVSIGLFDL